MAEIIDTEQKSSNDDPPKLSCKHKRKGKAKAVQSDKEDNNFVSSSSESESEVSETDLDCIEITNEEVSLCHLSVDIVIDIDLIACW